MKRYLTLAVFIILLILIFAAKRERSTWKQADTLRNGGSMTISVSKIKPNPNNPRLIKDDKFKKLVQSIKDFPDMLNKRPIVVNKDMIVLGGNMRLKACIEAGMKEVPVIVADWSEEQQREFIIKDNVSGGEWDWDVLANEWDANKLTEWGLDVPDIQQLDAEEDDFDVPEGGIETDIVLGDLFEIGEHRLLCGDSTDSDAVGRLICLIRDVFIWLAWNKDQFTLGRGKYQNKYEPIWFGWVDNGTTFYGDRTQTNVWDIPRPKKSEEHPTMKPVELAAKAVEHASRKDDMVLDLFLGSGTTMVAAHQLNRKCYGMELDPKYCQVIIDRMLKLDPSLKIKRNGQEYVKTGEIQAHANT
jgi:hypothetical protein